jgi:Xaa-Pro dipeptidase
MFAQRMDRLVESMSRLGIDVLALNPGPSMLYLTGLPFHLMERPTLLLVKAGETPVLVYPQLEAAKLDSAPFAIRQVTYGDNPDLWPQAFRQAADLIGMDGKTIGLEPLQLRVLELRYLETAAPNSRFVSAETLLSAQRMAKDANEVAAMREAVIIAQEALKATLPFLKIGTTEKAIASELVSNLLRLGSEPNLPFHPIVSSGPNSANPHASPSARTLQPGDLLVIDWGATCCGYFSDLTRTFAVGAVEEEYRLIARLVMQANAAGRAAARPGIPAGDVDRAARQVIRDGGYAERFTHRTGHGLGMEEHENPYIYAENTLVLAPGMTFTVEPGIYLTGRGGVRIEDNVVITASGAESLSDLPRELITVG